MGTGTGLALAILVGLPVSAWWSTRGALATVQIGPDSVVVRARGLSAVWALRRQIVLPAAAVLDITVQHRPGPRGFRLPGTYIPGVVKAGTFRDRQRREFWLVGRARQVLVIDAVQDAPFARVAVQVESPEAVAAEWRRPDSLSAESQLSL